jgi:hypothetical protein
MIIGGYLAERKILLCGQICMRFIDLGHFEHASNDDQRQMFGDDLQQWIREVSLVSHFQWLTRAPKLEEISFSINDRIFLSNATVLQHLPPLIELREIRIRLLGDAHTHWNEMDFTSDFNDVGFPVATHTQTLTDFEHKISQLLLFRPNIDFRLNCPKLQRILLCIECPYLRRVYQFTPAIHSIITLWCPSFSALSPVEQGNFLQFDVARPDER